MTSQTEGDHVVALADRAAGLRARRLALGKTQEQVAQMAEISHRTVATWENGQFSTRPSRALQRLEAVLLELERAAEQD